MKLTNDDVQEILRLLDGTAYDELHLQTDTFRLSLKRTPGQGGWTQETRTLTPAQVTPLREPAAPAPPGESSGPSAGAAAAEGLEEIRSPMVGTFYRAPKPGSPPFVEIGSRVTEHTVIAIIEVMKLMNSIAAGVTGEVVEILVQDAQFVEKGQVLMRVRPAAS
jgi:acetyl-CoA carboxylase biotin carboxyl carrier protein